MARKTRKRRRKQPNTLGAIASALSWIARADVLGTGLVLVSVFTLLSLLTGSRGRLTGAWIDLLQTLTGVGVWAVPLLTGILGLWMVIRAIERMPDLPWQRPLGLTLLFLAVITGVTLAVPMPTRLSQAEGGGAGGWLGYIFATLLESSLRSWGAWAAVTFLAIIGLVLLTDRLLLDGLQALWFELSQALEEQRRGRAPRIQPTLPLPSGQPAWWKRILNRRRLSAPEEPPIIGRPATVSPREARPGPARRPAQEEPRPSRAPATAPTESATLTPRIVGGGQSWRLPDIDQILESWDRYVDSDEHIRNQGRLIQETLALFGVPADFEGAYKGPAVTQYLIKPGYIERTVKGEVKRTKVKVSKIAGLANDLALALAAPSVRIEAPIPGTSYVGVEVPNSESNVVGLKELMLSEEFQALRQKGRLPITLGEDVKGQPVLADLARMPHLLIAGATGSGKSVCVNAIISCLLLTHTPDTLRLLLIDPKMVELSVYDGIPHLLSPVITEVDRAAGVLFWAVKEMERRYQLLNKGGARDLERYNARLRKQGEKPLPYIVIIVDEMADLMMAAPEEVEKHVCRLAQMARAVGIHLIIATQRPSVDVITGLIKANFPARIAFAVTSQVDSRVILDTPGAERLLGRGDMLFMAPDASKLERIQGTFVSDEEIQRLIHYWKGIRSLEAPSLPPEGPPASDTPPPPILETPDSPAAPARAGQGKPQAPWKQPGLSSQAGSGPSSPAPSGPGGPGRPAQPTEQPPLFEQIEALKAVESRDALFDEAVKVVQKAGRGSVTLLQRKLRVGYSRASRLVDQLEEAGILGPDQGGNQGRPLLKPGPESQDGPAPSQGREGEEKPPPRIWM